MGERNGPIVDLRTALVSKRFDRGIPTTAHLSDFEKSWATGAADFFPRTNSLPATREWVAKTISATVKLNNRGGQIATESREIKFSELPRTTREFDISSLETVIVPADPTISWHDHMEQRVLSILMNPYFRRGDRTGREPYLDQIGTTIKRRTIKAEPIQIVLSAMAFKDQNPLNTQHSMEQTDLGEYLVMAQMRDLVRSIKGDYPPGVKVIMASDGVIFSDLFGDGDVVGAQKYADNLRKIRDEMGLRDQVEIVDMTWLTDRDSETATVRNHIKGIITDLEASDVNFRDKIHALSHGMFWNIPLPGYSMEEVAAFANLPLDQLPIDLSELLHSRAIDYAALLLTLSHLQLFDRAFPGAVRGTIHPKDAAQIPLHLVNSECTVFPYNGVPVLSRRQLGKGRSLRQATRIARYHEVLEKPGATAVYIPGGTEPFYYEVD